MTFRKLLRRVSDNCIEGGITMAVRKKREAAATMTKMPTKTEMPVEPKAAQEAAPVEEVKPVAEVQAPAEPEKKEVVPEFYVQYMGKDVSATETVKAVHQVWTEEMGHQVEEIKELRMYFRTEINRCYFVINNEYAGSVAI